MSTHAGALLRAALAYTYARRRADDTRFTFGIEGDGDALADLHLWCLGPGHLGAIGSIGTRQQRDPDFYRARLARFRSLSYLTIEVHSVG